MNIIKKAAGSVRSLTRTIGFGIFMLEVSARQALASSVTSSGAGLSWEDPLDKILTSLRGPVARFFILAAIITTGLMMAFGEHGSGFKKLLGIVFGASMVLGVVSFVSTLFGASF